MNAKTALTLSAASLLAACGAVMAAEPAQPGSDEIRATVAEMLSDAETRSSLLAAGDSGYDGKFFLAGDGYRLNIGGNMQFRYYADFRNDTPTDDGFESGFQMGYAQLWFDGTVNKDWVYKIQGNFETETGTFTLEDAYFAHVFSNGWMFIGGQVKAPLLRETLVDNYKQLAVETSVAEAFFGGGRTQAVALAKQADAWSFILAFSDGAFADNTDFTSFNGVSEADYSLTPRFQWKFAGDWKQFDDFTSPRGSQFACMLGGALHWQQSRNTNNPTDTDIQLFRYTIDLSVEGDGWNVYGAFYGSYTDPSTLTTNPDATNDLGFDLQGGFMLGEHTELFGRYDAILADSDRNWADDNVNFVTIGVNEYFAGHAAKFTFDGVISLNDTSGLVSSGTLPSTAIGLLGDTDSGEVVLRAQFQLMF
jgi:hypothetical protein